MDKLRHIHSKIGSETAFRIPVSVEDAIAEAVEAYDLMRMAAEAEAKRGDELAARVERLDKAARELLCNLSGYHHTIDGINIKDDLREALGEKRAASLLLHDAQVIRDVAYKLTFTPIIHDRFYKGYDQAIADVRAAADALEGEGDE
jgi:hypothetical protein